MYLPLKKHEKKESNRPQTQNLISFGEGKRDQCILVYSGIHYDRIAFSYSEYPYTDPTLPPEMDRTIWSVEDEEVLSKAQELVEKLYNAHYFTNMDGMAGWSNTTTRGATAATLPRSS